MTTREDDILRYTVRIRDLQDDLADAQVELAVRTASRDSLRRSLGEFRALVHDIAVEVVEVHPAAYEGLDLLLSQLGLETLGGRK